MFLFQQMQMPKGQQAPEKAESKEKISALVADKLNMYANFVNDHAEKISKAGLTGKIDREKVAYWRRTSAEDIRDHMKDKAFTVENVDRSMQQLTENAFRQMTDAIYFMVRNYNLIAFERYAGRYLAIMDSYKDYLSTNFKPSERVKDYLNK